MIPYLVIMTFPCDLKWLDEVEKLIDSLQIHVSSVCDKAIHVGKLNSW